MEKRLYLNLLYDYYKELFTIKQQEYFEDYYYNNLSLSEIAENHSVSRNAVHNQLKIVETKLKEFEQALGLYSTKQKVLNLLNGKIDQELLDQIEQLM